jgi:hypothetical protein
MLQVGFISLHATAVAAVEHALHSMLFLCSLLLLSMAIAVLCLHQRLGRQQPLVCSASVLPASSCACTLQSSTTVSASLAQTLRTITEQRKCVPRIMPIRC